MYFSKGVIIETLVVAFKTFEFTSFSTLTPLNSWIQDCELGSSFMTIVSQMTTQRYLDLN